MRNIWISLIKILFLATRSTYILFNVKISVIIYVCIDKFLYIIICYQRINMNVTVLRPILYIRINISLKIIHLIVSLIKLIAVVAYTHVLCILHFPTACAHTLIPAMSHTTTAMNCKQWSLNGPQEPSL
jgi:hypothetical protein